ncbi:hypothetical protein [Novosphingobium mangrovi (ex Huang et al. 2023)]|uniref:PRC-barrel domain-containing protein n=1 Tax=Novosphingobium mangrovi (ex Huang et al. 2023) TaxID=2976432 RepID=A0ABT2I854_9SPHN|nr:hypothetical protein [Novosphingobium mangrovi (ex Huang et al. 2023)]MCT2400998.1 hypothetical protein [Novosphingobium mangrovi (ex Huang et al. 2023)]
MKNSLIAAAIAAASLAPVAAWAQDAAASAVAPTVGAKVFGPEGNEVGTVESVQAGVITVSTGAARAGLPASAFAMREKGLTIGMTKAQLEAAVNGAKAQTDAAKEAAMVVDAPVKSNDGVVLGTISKIEGDDVTVLLSNGASAILKKSYLGLVDNALTLGMTAEAFASQTQASAPAQASSDAAAPASGEAAATDQ